MRLGAALRGLLGGSKHVNPRGQKGSLYIFWPLGIPELQLAVDPLGGS